MPTTTTGTIIQEQADPTPRGAASTPATNDVVLLRLGTVASAFSGTGAESVVFTCNGELGPIQASLAELLVPIIRNAACALNGQYAAS